MCQKPRDPIVQQIFIRHHSALTTAAGAGDTRMDKRKPVPLRKPGASSDNSANVLEWRRSPIQRKETKTPQSASIWCW